MHHVARDKWGGQPTRPVQMVMGPYVVPGIEYVWCLELLRQALVGLCP